MAEIYFYANTINVFDLLDPCGACQGQGLLSEPVQEEIGQGCNPTG